METNARYRTVTATIDTDAASQLVWDVVVVGAGPAGSLAAEQLAHRGFSVLLVDRSAFPREKVCGCCLNAGALHALRCADLIHVVQHAALPHIDGLHLRARGASAHVRLRGGVVMSRGRLDAALCVAAIESGVQFLPGTRVVASGVNGSTRDLTIRSRGRDQVLRCRLVIDASGLGGRWTSRSRNVHRRSYIGVSAIGRPVRACSSAESRRIEMSCGSRGYVGAVRLEDGRMNIAAAICPRYLRSKGGPFAAVSAIFTGAGADAPDGLDQWQWTGTGHLTTRPQSAGSERLLAIGDAAGYVEPFTGEGIEWALQSALLVAPVAERAIGKWDDRTAAQWGAIHRNAFRWRHIRCHVLAGALRRPMLLRAAVGVTRAVPVIAESIGNEWSSRRSCTEALSARGVA